MKHLNPYAIVEITTQGLFGYIDQTLKPINEHRDKISQLAILYGENGTGKTSLLRLAFYLLSPRVDRGHKSRLAITPFKIFKIILRDGTIFKAERESARSGNYIFSVTPPKGNPITHDFDLDSGEISVLPYKYSRLLEKEIVRCASTIIFLRDDRWLDIDPNIDQGSPWAELFVDPRTQSRTKIQRIEDERSRMREQPDQMAAALRFSIERLDRWFSIQYGQQTSTGMASSHAIYEQVILKVASTPQPQTAAMPLDKIIEALVQVSEESTVFEKYGLSSRMDVDAIVQTLRSARDSQIGILEGLLMPYGHL